MATLRMMMLGLLAFGLGGLAGQFAKTMRKAPAQDEPAESVGSSPGLRAHAAAEQVIADLSVQYAAEYAAEADDAEDDDGPQDAVIEHENDDEGENDDDEDEGENDDDEDEGENDDDENVVGELSDDEDETVVGQLPGDDDDDDETVTDEARDDTTTKLVTDDTRQKDDGVVEALVFSEIVFAERRRRFTSFLGRLLASWCKRPAEIYLRQ